MSYLKKLITFTLAGLLVSSCGDDNNTELEI